MNKEEIETQLEFINKVNDKLLIMQSEWYVQEKADHNRLVIYNGDSEFIRVIKPLTTPDDTAMMIRQCEWIANEYYLKGVQAGHKELAAKFRAMIGAAELSE